MVVCNMRVQPLAWPLAIASSLLYALLFGHSKLYGEASLQGVFVLIALWGWWQWVRQPAGAAPPLVVHHLSATQRWQALALTLAAWPLLGWVLQHVTDSDVPYLDALPTVGSITGQILLGRKAVDNWPVWVLVNLVSIALFAVKGLWLTVLLYALFTGMAWAGWRVWSRLAQGAPRAA
ncbi:MAG: nicotinamide mononucleotide transporter [Burkholderiales bacterium]|nr:nicotinamide mononucleotide transporter [Burkholderiales bacterium]